MNLGNGYNRLFRTESQRIATKTFLLQLRPGELLKLKEPPSFNPDINTLDVDMRNHGTSGRLRLERYIATIPDDMRNRLKKIRMRCRAVEFRFYANGMMLMALFYYRNFPVLTCIMVGDGDKNWTRFQIPSHPRPLLR